MTVEEIISIICQHTGVDHTLIYRRDHNDRLWNTRYMIWHYLHCVQGVPTSKLCAMFHRNRPTIFRGIRMFRNHVKLYKDVRNDYHELLKKIEGMAKATPSENIVEEKN